LILILQLPDFIYSNGKLSCKAAMMFVRGCVENQKLSLLPPLLLLMSCRNSDVRERIERAVEVPLLPPRGPGTTAAAAFQ